jgi:hypothetical protein
MNDEPSEIKWLIQNSGNRTMTASYLPYEPQQQMLLPHALQEWLPEGHLAYYISDTIDSLNLSAFHA